MHGEGNDGGCGVTKARLCFTSRRCLMLTCFNKLNSTWHLPLLSRMPTCNILSLSLTTHIIPGEEERKEAEEEGKQEHVGLVPCRKENIYTLIFNWSDGLWEQERRMYVCAQKRRSGNMYKFSTGAVCVPFFMTFCCVYKSNPLRCWPETAALKWLCRDPSDGDNPFSLASLHPVSLYISIASISPPGFVLIWEHTQW